MKRYAPVRYLTAQEQRIFSSALRRSVKVVHVGAYAPADYISKKVGSTNWVRARRSKRRAEKYDRFITQKEWNAIQRAWEAEQQ
jgi:hypothetical protein